MNFVALFVAGSRFGDLQAATSQERDTNKQTYLMPFQEFDTYFMFTLETLEMHSFIRLVDGRNRSYSCVFK